MTPVHSPEESISIQQILQYLPHRYPFLMVDRVEHFVPNQSLHAIKNVTINEPCFMGHFPEKPVMPGVLMIEALAQASGLLAFLSSQTERPVPGLFFLAGVNQVTFKHVVEPGDQLNLEVELVKARMDFGKFLGKASVKGQVVCTAELLIARKG